MPSNDEQVVEPQGLNIWKDLGGLSKDTQEVLDVEEFITDVKEVKQQL
jgi:hypothetical protein